MLKKIPLIGVFWFFGCTTTEPKDWSEEIRTLQWKSIQTSYEMHMERCFVNYQLCVLKNGTDCWDTHEQCVINTNNWYKTVFEKNGF